MTTQLLFEDETVEEVQVVIRNAGDGLSDALKVAKTELHLGDQVAYILRGTVVGVQFKQKDDDSPVARVHIIKTIGITGVELEMADRILAADRESVARRKAEIQGQMELEESGYLEGQEAVADLHERKAAKKDALDTALDADTGE